VRNDLDLSYTIVEVLKTFYPDDNYYAYKDASGFKPKKGIKKALSAFAHPFEQ